MRRAVSGRSTSSNARARALSGLVLVGLMLAAVASRAVAQSGNTSGTTLYTFGSTVSQDESSYTVTYSIPSAIHTGVKTNMTFYVYVTLLSGWKIQSQTQILQIIINTPNKQVVTQEAQNNVTLYQGGRWGPFNMTLDVNDSQAGLPAGSVTNATVFANLVVYEAYDNPVSPFVHDDGITLELTTLQIEASSDGNAASEGRLLASLAIGAAVIAVLAGASVSIRKRGVR